MLETLTPLERELLNSIEVLMKSLAELPTITESNARAINQLSSKWTQFAREQENLQTQLQSQFNALEERLSELEMRLNAL